MPCEGVFTSGNAGRPLPGLEIPFRVKENESIKFVSHLIRFCVVIIFGGVVDARWSPNDSRYLHTVRNLLPREPRPLRHLLSDAHALSLIEGVAAAFSRGEQHKSFTQNQLGLQSGHELPSTAPNERLQPIHGAFWPLLLPLRSV